MQNDSPQVVHDCAFNNDHTPLSEPEAFHAVSGGFCPLCLHDFADSTPDVDICIECGHAFTFTTTQPPQIQVFPIEP